MIEFRPHHFMCTLGFEGKGYSHGFVRNYQKISATLGADPQTPIQVVNQLDSICKACPHQTSVATCKKQSFIDALDHAHQKALGLVTNQVLSWTQAKEIIRKKMTLEKFHAACAGCEWKAYGICESALKKLKCCAS